MTHKGSVNVLSMVILILTGILCLMAISTVAEGITVDRVLATVNNDIVTLSDYRRFISQAGLTASSDIIDETLLRKLIDEKIILFEAKKNGYDVSESEVIQTISDFQKNNNFTDDEFHSMLAEEGMTITDYRILVKENLISLKFIDREVNSKVIVTDKEIDEYYNKNMTLFADKPERLLVKAIFINLNDSPSVTEITDLKIKSLKIISEIKNGEPFAKMIDRYADEPLKSHDGILGEFEKGTLINELDIAISSLREGEVSSPIWTDKGVYILMIDKKIQGSYIPLTAIKEQIYTILYKQKREEQFNKWLRSLWENSSITIKN